MTPKTLSLPVRSSIKPLLAVRTRRADSCPAAGRGSGRRRLAGAGPIVAVAVWPGGARVGEGVKFADAVLGGG